MCALRVLTRSLTLCSSNVKCSKPYYLNQPFPVYQHQSHRNLILESSASEFVKLHKLHGSDSGIVEVSLDRPGAKNAIGKDMLRGLSHAFELIDQNSYANVVIISSSVPGVFCAGADLKERRTMNQSEVKVFVNSLRTTFSFLEAVRVPTLAVIEGAAFGGGLEMALACDIRICGEDALMGLPETGLAIIPGICVSIFVHHNSHDLFNFGFQVTEDFQVVNVSVKVYRKEISFPAKGKTCLEHLLVRKICRMEDMVEKILVLVVLAPWITWNTLLPVSTFQVFL